MGKLSKKLKKAAIAGAALYAANKAMTSSIGKHRAAKSLQGDRFAKARKAMTSNKAYRGKPGLISRKDILPKIKAPDRNLYNEWDSIIKAPSVPKPKRKRTNLFQDTYKKGGGVTGRAKGGITKARGGVMVNTKLNGKLYTETF
tara:strand:- start:582 stop:1013 length:432 start_codon:yes stop_codon:yes gene_type:complete